MPDDEQTARDLQAYNQVLQLWKQENPIKTTKLQVMLAVNAGLLAVVQFNGGLPEPRNRLLFALGALLSAVWTLSIGRTSLYQQYWKHKLRLFAEKYPSDPRFQVTNVSAVANIPGGLMKTLGGVSSKYYLLGAPILFTFGWLAMLICSLLG